MGWLARWLEWLERGDFPDVVNGAISWGMWTGLAAVIFFGDRWVARSYGARMAVKVGFGFAAGLLPFMAVCWFLAFRYPAFLGVLVVLLMSGAMIALLALARLERLKRGKGG